nr:zinc finger, CCHC-type [Tanacetum cinerariifolium]
MNALTLRFLIEKEKLNGYNFFDWRRILMINPKYVGKLHHIDSPLFEPHVAIATLMHVVTYQALLAKEGGVNKMSWKKGKGMSKGRKKVPPPPKKESIEKDAEYFHCRKTRHWKRNFPSYLAELKRGKQTSSSARTDSSVYALKEFCGLCIQRVLWFVHLKGFAVCVTNHMVCVLRFVHKSCGLCFAVCAF